MEQEYKDKSISCYYTYGCQKHQNSYDCTVSWKAKNHRDNTTTKENRGGNQQGEGWYKRSNNS